MSGTHQYPACPPLRRKLPQAGAGPASGPPPNSTERPPRNVPPTTLTSPPPTYVGAQRPNVRWGGGTYVRAERPNVRWGGGDVARPRWDLTLATYVAVVPPSHLKGPLLQGTTPGAYPATPPWTLGRKVGSHPTTPPGTFAGNVGGIAKMMIRMMLDDDNSNINSGG